MPSGITVKVEVNQIVKEFFVSKNGSNVIILKKGDYISHVVRELLYLVPKNYHKIQHENYLIINLIYWNKRGINIKYRNYLDEKAQKIVFEHLYSLFKEVFYSFMLGSVEAGIQQKLAINNFCDLFNIKCNHISYEMLKKSWDRSDEKKRWIYSKEVFADILREKNSRKVKKHEKLHIKKEKQHNNYKKPQKSGCVLSFTQLTINYD